MAKRFTDTEKWKKQFIKSLSTIHKLFFFYLLDDCDHAGIWHVEPEIAAIRIGENVDIAEVKGFLGKHIIEFDNGEKWFIPYFVEFQYGELKDNVNAHKSVKDRLTKYKLLKTYQQFINPSSRVKDKDKDKDMDMDEDMKTYDEHMENENEIENEEEIKKDKEIINKVKKLFDNFRKLYPGTKKGLNTEFNNYKKKHQDYKSVIVILLPALLEQKRWRKEMATAGMFVPEWKHLQTWINQRCWEEEKPEIRHESQEQKKPPPPQEYIKPEVEVMSDEERVEYNKTLEGLTKKFSIGGNSENS